MKRGEAHEEELKLSRAEIAERNSGLAWALPMAKAAQGHLRKAWLARDAGSYGHGKEEKRNREWERNAREVRMWHKLKGEFCGLAGAEFKINGCTRLFYFTVLYFRRRVFVCESTNKAHAGDPDHHEIFRNRKCESRCGDGGSEKI